MRAWYYSTHSKDNQDLTFSFLHLAGLPLGLKSKGLKGENRGMQTISLQHYTP
jgi:hypothetical protein